MKTKKQAATDLLNETATSWINSLKEEPNRASQYVWELDRFSAAMSGLNLEKLTVAQQRALTKLLGSVARAAFASGIDLGKTFKK